MSCCPNTTVLPAQGVEYKPTGQSGLYVSGKPSDPIVLFVPDIFGFHPFTLTTADAIASKGFRVYWFDYFMGSTKAWDLAKPLAVPGDEAWASFGAYITSQDVFSQVRASAEYLRMLNGGAPVPSIGFCWGAAMLARLAGLENGPLSCAAMPHPSFVTVASAEAARVPILLMPAEDDGEMADVKAKLEERKLLAGYHFAKGCCHGFSAARFGKSKNIEDDKANRQIVIDLTAAMFAKFTAGK